MPKTRETDYAIFYDKPNDQAAVIMAAMANAAVQVTNTLHRERQRKQEMQQLWVTLSADAQKQLFESWSPKDKKFYGLTPREKTEVERAQETSTIAESKIRQNQAEQIPLLNEQLRQQVDAGKITLAEAQRKAAIIENKDGKFSDWEVAWAQDLKGDDAEKYVLQKRYPELADEMLQIANKVGPKYRDRLVSEYFQKINSDTGQVDPKYTLRTAQALADATATGNIEELNKLNNDPKWPRSMRTLAYQNFQLDRDKLQRQIAESTESDRRTRASLSVQLMNTFPELVGPTTAGATVDALMSGKQVPGWTQDRWNQALKMKSDLQGLEVAKRSTDLAKEMSGIPEIRSAIDSLRQLETAEIGEGNARQIEALKKQLMTRMAKQYGLDPSEFEDPGSMWGRIFSATIGYMSTGVQAGVALAGDALSASSGDSLMNQLMQDESGRVSPGGMVPTGRQVGLPGVGQSSLMDILPDMPTPQATHPATRAQPRPDRTSVLDRQAQRLISEYATATPERQQTIRLLLKAIKDDPDGAKIK